MSFTVQKKFWLCMLAAGVLSGYSSLNAEQLVPASSTLINYYGRFDFSTSDVAQFNWSGSAIEAAFTGMSIGIELVDGSADYDVTIDGVYYSTIQTVSGTTKYSINSSLTGSTHTIRVVQRSEQHWNTASFKGFYIADGASLVTPPPRPSKRIEFIGDSYTVGYGNESNGRTCSSAQLRNYTNTNKSFGKIVADAFNAECMALGWSGEGMVRNYGESTQKSVSPYPAYYNKTLGALSTIWDFTTWTPDLVVICLGTNDFSTTPYPDDTMYINAYHAFIATVRGNYPDAPIVCVGTNTGSMNTLLKTIVNTEMTTNNRTNICYAEFPQSLTYNGCDWHPSTVDDTAIAEVLINTIKRNFGWDTMSTAVSFRSRSPAAVSKSCSVKYVNRSIVISLQSGIYSSELTLSTINGKTVAKRQARANELVTWRVPGIHNGMYILSDKNNGLTHSIVVRNNL